VRCKGSRCLRLTTLLYLCPDCLKILGIYTSWNPKGLPRPVMRYLYLYLYIQLYLQSVFIPFWIFCYIFYTYVFITFSMRATYLAILFLSRFCHSILWIPDLRVIFLTVIFVQFSFISHSWVPYIFFSIIFHNHKDKHSMDNASSFSKQSHCSFLKKSLTQFQFRLKNAVWKMGEKGLVEEDWNDRDEWRKKIL
jgi:hypothetical protein